MKVVLLLCVVLLSWVMDTLAQKAQLTDEEITAVIAQGVKAKGEEQGLVLKDVASALFSKGVDLQARLYTPSTWIAQQASQAAKEYRPFTLKDVTEDMRAPVLRVTIMEEQPINSFQHVVLRDQTKTQALQPTVKESFLEEVTASSWAGMFGASTYVQGIRAQFPLDGLRTLRGPQGDQEFFLTVIGVTQVETTFKIKKKHFAKLP